MFGLQGGHIQPIWDFIAQQGIEIIDVRDDGAAVHMAHAHAELTGELGVCLATAGPGVTNCVTGIAKGASRPVQQLGGDGKNHPMAIFEAMRKVADADYIGIADGGDLLSFARIGLDTSTYLDAGAFGCLGIGGTLLRHSDYAEMARALGAHGERVEDPADLADAVRRGLENAPALIDVVTSQDAVSSDATKGLGFVPNYQPLTAWDDAERRRRGEI